MRLRWGRLQVPTAIESNFYAFLCLFTLSTLISNLEFSFFCYFSFRYTFFFSALLSVLLLFLSPSPSLVATKLPSLDCSLRSLAVLCATNDFSNSNESIGRATPISFASTAGMRLLPACPLAASTRFHPNWNCLCCSCACLGHIIIIWYRMPSPLTQLSGNPSAPPPYHPHSHTANPHATCAQVPRVVSFSLC